MISHWDDVRTWRGERGHIAGTWQSLTGQASRTVGVKRIQVDPGMWATPLHLEGAEEEIFYVLAGAGISVQWEGEDTLGYDVRCGRLRRPPRARERPHAAGRRRRDRRSGIRSAHVCGCDVASTRGSGVARRDLGSGRRRGGSSLGTRGRGRAARDHRDVAEARRTSSTWPTSSPSSATAPPLADAFGTSGRRQARSGQGSATRRSFRAS